MIHLIIVQLLPVQKLVVKLHDAFRDVKKSSSSCKLLLLVVIMTIAV